MMNKKLFNLICVLMWCNMDESYGVVVFYGKTRDSRYLDTSSQLIVRSSIECCLLCQNKQNCRIVSYHKTNNICEISSNPSIKDVYLSSVAGWDMLTLAVTCAAGWTKHKTSCYIMSTKFQTWDGSQTECGLLHGGGHLADLHSEAIQGLLKHLYSQVPVTHQKIWVGGRRDSDGIYKWTDQSRVPDSFQNWIPDQPDFYQGNEYCMQVQTDRNFQWNDDECHNSGLAFCEY